MYYYVNYWTKLLEEKKKENRAQKSKMRDTVPGIISLSYTIRATLDDLNGPEVTFLSLSIPSAPLCVSVDWYHRATKLFTMILRGYCLFVVQCNYYALKLLSAAITITTLHAVWPAHVACKFSNDFLLLKEHNISRS